MAAKAYEQWLNVALKKYMLNDQAVIEYIIGGGFVESR